MKIKIIGLLCALAWLGTGSVFAHPGHEEHPPESELTRSALPPEGLIGAWLFWPSYILPGDAGTLSNPVPINEALPSPLSERESPSRNWLGQSATDRKRRLLRKESLPSDAFTIEFWVTYHVDQPIGASAMAFDADHNRPAVWEFGFWQGDVQFSVGETELRAPVMELKSNKVAQDLDAGTYKRGVDRYWHHLVGTFDGSDLMLFHQGELISSRARDAASIEYPDGTEFELAAYLANEPHMKLGNLLRNVALYDRALTQEEIAIRFEDHRELVDKAVHFRDVFHFTTAAPHIAFPTMESIQISWEADRVHAALVEWGTTPALGNSKRLPM